MGCNVPTEPEIRQAADLLGDEYYLIALVQHVLQDQWADQVPSFWMWQLDGEIDELFDSMEDRHSHPPEWELVQIAALCINWLRHHGREGWLLECIDLLDKREVDGGEQDRVQD